MGPGTQNPITGTCSSQEKLLFCGLVGFWFPLNGLHWDGETDFQEGDQDPREREGIGRTRFLALLMKNGSDIELFTLAKDISEGPLERRKDIGQFFPGFLVFCYFLRTGSDCL